MSASIRDVAARAGVSTATVSNVLNGRRVRDDGIDRAVRDAAAALGYRASEAASNLRRSRSRVVGMVVPDLRNPFFARLVDGVQRVAGDDGYRTFVASSRESVDAEIREIASFRGWKAAGLLVVPAGDGARYARPDALGGLPGVLLDRVPGRCAFDSVGVDDAAATRVGLGRLASLGHRRVLALGASVGAPNLEARLLACRAAAAEHGTILLEHRIAHPGADRFDADEADRLAATLTARDPPTAVFGLSIVATRSVLGVIGRCGLAMPSRLSLLGFDDSRWLEAVHPGIAAIAQPVEAMARAGWSALSARLDDEDAPPRAAVLACEPRWRDSVATAPAV